MNNLPRLDIEAELGSQPARVVRPNIRPDPGSRRSSGTGAPGAISDLAFGERGEGAKLWKQPGMTLARIKAARRAEAEAAAEKLGLHDLICMDLGDYPLELTRAGKDRLTGIMRAVEPAFMLSHSTLDPDNTDPVLTTQVVLECRSTAQAWGHSPGEPVLGAPQRCLFEPHQTEQMGWKPDTFLDITPVWDRKRAAIEGMAGQEHLWDFATRVARNRANHFTRNSGGQPCQSAEGFQAIVPAPWMNSDGRALPGCRASGACRGRYRQVPAEPGPLHRPLWPDVQRHRGRPRLSARLGRP